MQIIILGMGCPRCQRLASNAEAAAKQLGLTYTVEEITDRERIEREFHPGALPALVLDGRIVSEGQVLETEAIVPLMTSANEAERVFDVTARAAAPKVPASRRLLAFAVLAVLVVLAVALSLQRQEEAPAAEPAASVAASVPPLVVSEMK